jgi:hypothetical protein
MIVPIYAKVSCNNSNTNFVLNAEVYYSFNTLETWKDYQQFGDYAQPVILPRTADTQKIHTGIFFSKTPLVDFYCYKSICCVVFKG